MKISDLTKEIKSLEIAYTTGQKDFPVALEYRTQAVTVDFMRSIETALPLDRVIKQIEKIVVKWDLQDDDKQVIPITEEAIINNKIPVNLLLFILERLSTDARSLREAKND